MCAAINMPSAQAPLLASSGLASLIEVALKLS